MENMKKTDMAVLEDKIKNFKFIRHVRTKADKNHALGTDTKNHGCIPFMNFTKTFNPGLFFEFYLTLLPDENGTYLFPQPRQSSKKWDNFNEDDCMFETKKKVGKNMIYKMLPELCLACDRPRQTNHSLRATAIMYMRRAGLDWETIVKITGHKDTVNIVKFYDLKL